MGLLLEHKTVMMVMSDLEMDAAINAKLRELGFVQVLHQYVQMFVAMGN